MAIAISTYTLSKGESQKVIRRWKQKDGPWDDAIFLFVFFKKNTNIFFPYTITYRYTQQRWGATTVANIYTSLTLSNLQATDVLQKRLPSSPRHIPSHFNTSERR